MATYTKETALYDTGKIGNDIASAGQTATNYLTTISGTSGISVHNANDTANFVNMNSEGVGIYQGGVNVAQFGATTRIGTDTDASITIDDANIVGVGEGGKEFFNFSNSSATILTRFSSAIPSFAGLPANEWPTTTATGFSIVLDRDPTNDLVLYLQTPTTVGANVSFTFGTAVSSKTISVTSGSTTYSVKVKYDGARTFSQIYLSSGTTGTTRLTVRVSYKAQATAPSYELGGETSATGGYALTEGISTTASGNYSHAEGNSTTASGQSSHAEGSASTASGDFSHASGWDTTASGTASFSTGIGTIAAGSYQTAIGKYNVSDTTTNAFIIGKGSQASNRANAFAVDWSGNVNIASGAKYKINGTALTASDVGAVPTTRKVNNKALSADVTLSASDVSAVPTTRTVNSKALSADITLSASDVSAVPTTRTVNSKALSADITLTASDVSAVPTTRTVNSKALSADISLTASDVGAVPTTTTVNGKALSANVADADYVTEEGSKTSGSVTWTYRKWNSGKIEAWCGYTFASSASTVWTSPIRYWDKTVNIPSGIFSAAPRVMATSQSTQYWVGGCTASNATTASIRVLTAASGSMALNVNIYAVAG